IAYNYSYDANGRLTSVQYPGLSAATIYRYNPFPDNSLVSETDPNGNSSTAFYYDSTNDGGNSLLDGRLKSITGPSVQDANGITVHYTTQYQYTFNSDGTITTTITNPDGGVVARKDDSFGKPLSITDPLNRPTNYVYYTDACRAEQLETVT